MRVGIVALATVLIGACASIVNLDKADDPAQSSATSSSSGEAKGKTDGGHSSSSGAASSSGALTDAGGDAAPKIPDSCTKNEDCPQNDDDHDHCSNAGKCTKTCLKEGTPCLKDAPDFPCCFGLECKDPPVGSINLCQVP